MTTLDEKALEAAIAAWKPGPITTEERARSLVTAYLDALPLAWQPIDTAPKDGTCILIAGGFFDWDASWGETLPYTGVTIASWKDIGTGKPWQGENCGGHDEYYRYAPTHWMPLPPAPAQEG